MGSSVKLVGLYLEASTAICRIALEFRLDPFPRRANAAPRRDRSRVLRRECQSRSKAHQLFDVGPNVLRGHLRKRRCDPRVGADRFRWNGLRVPAVE